MAVIEISSVAVIVNPAADNVAVARQAIHPGTQIRGLDGQAIVIRTEILPGHRFALQSIAAGEWVRQYGQPFAVSRGVLPGDPINAETVENRIPQIDPDALEIHPPTLPPWEGPLPTFMGFRRADGRAGVRNWILIVPTSNCSSHEASTIAMQAEFSGLYSREKYPNVDGVTATPHSRGCGCPDMVPAGEAGRKNAGIVEVTMRLLNNHIRHPNVGAALIIDLGCEKTNLADFNRYAMRDMHLLDARPRPSVGGDPAVRPVDLSGMYGKPVYSLSIQACGGSRATIKRGLELVQEMLEAANASQRSPIPASELVLGMECGGSDGFSGLTANPALGYASDLLVRAGGSAIISETPEFFGAEHLFAQRAASREVAQQIFDQIRRYREYAAHSGTLLDENPSPGNKEGGLLNITIKSLGAIAKAGTAPVQGTLDYGEPIWRRGDKGLYLMYGPGYDPESVPAMVASGCQLVCFTTGRGSVLGNAIAPVVKIATNTPMYRRMNDDMDVNAGEILEGSQSLPEMGQHIFDTILASASGQWTRSEVNGHREFTIWSEEGISL